ncbi:MAG: HD domain-containing phosphohydrolase [Trueperaceae bacterium]
MEAIDQLRSRLEAMGPLGKDLRPLLATVAREMERTERRLGAYARLNDVTAALAQVETTDDVDDVLDRILQAALELSGADRGLVVLRDEDHDDGFNVRAARRLGSDEASHDDVQLSRTLIRQILEHGEGVVTTNAQEDDRFQAGASLLALDIRSVMAAPIRLGDAAIGGIYLDTRFMDRAFDADDLATFERFADNAAIALNLATSIQERRVLYLQSVMALVNAVEAADAYTAGHSSRVGYYARGIARALGVADDDLERVAIAGYLHDVGKIAMTSNVSKPGALTDDEWLEMKRHPIHGERILRDAPALTPILPAVRHHHERWDGGGYPDGLAGEAIDGIARMLAVADSFDAMTTDRPYRAALPLDHALQEIRDGIGSAYEHAAADAFLQAFASGSLQLATTSDVDQALYDGLRDG